MSEELTTELRSRIRAVFRKHNATGIVRRGIPAAGDAELFLRTPEGAAGMNEARIADELQALLGRKVYVSTMPPAQVETEVI